MAQHQSDTQFVRRLFIAAGIGVLIVVLYLLLDLILVVFGAILVAMALRGLARPIAESCGLPNGWALLVACLGVVAVLAAGVLFLGPELVRQSQVLYQQLPGATERLMREFQLGSLSEMVKSLSTASGVASLVGRILAWSSALIGALTSLALIIVGGLYLAANPRLYREGFVKLFPPSLHAHINTALDDIGTALSQWLKGQLLAMLLIGLLTGIGLWFVGLPSAFALAFMAGLFEFIPYIGPIAAAIPALLIASAQDTTTLLWTLAVVVGVQQIENTLIVPFIAQRMVSVPAAVGLFAVVAMGILFGPLGLLFGFPLAVMIDTAVRRLYVRDTLHEPVEIVSDDQPTTRAVHVEQAAISASRPDESR